MVAISPESQEVIDFLNSWFISNESRSPVDRLDEWVSSTQGRNFTPTFDDQQIIDARRARAAIRSLIEGEGDFFSDFLSSRGANWVVDREGIRVVLLGEQVVINRLLELTIHLVNDGQVRRIKSCADCRWIFFDASRNNSRVWCAMDAAPGRRGCGSIAKSRRYRQRHQDFAEEAKSPNDPRRTETPHAS